MASDSPRSRIDQFFASKKRKAVSPCLKHERKEKSLKNIEGSPSAKGTLDSYLVASQGEGNSDKPSRAGHDSLALQDSVKRSLSLEINKSRKDDCERQLSSFQSRVADDFEPNQKETSRELLEVAGVAVGHSGKGSSSDLVQGAENSELKKFKNDFLSLYCSDLQSNVDLNPELKVSDHKRQASPLLIDNSKKRHCVADQSHLECETTCSNEKSSQDIHSTVGKTEVTTEDESNDLVTFQSSLKKCSNISKSSPDKIELHTPGSLTAKICFRETPKSACRSSLFSPGEAFWDEAIQLADGLCHPTVNFCAKAADEVGFAESRCCKKNSDNLIEKINEGASTAPSTSLQGLLGRPGNELEEKSHFPVKHFDFLFDDKNLDGSIVRNGDTNNIKVSHEGGVSSESSSDLIDHSCPKNDNNFNHHNTGERNKEICGEQEMTPIVAVAKKGNLLDRDDESMKYNSPIDGIRKSIGNSECGQDTPSSIMPRKDWLDLNSWLPSEICSIYRKKGISKLYQWQVDCLQVDGVLQRRNLVYCASTSAGKSFVAEILMLRRVLSFGKMALLVLPYVSICAEKAEHLEVLLEPLGKHVRSYYGNQGGGTLPKDTSVAVCTIEKANSLLNRLLEEGRLSEIGIIVIDELHMVGDRNRGYLLELMLTKLRYAAGEGNSGGSSGESSGTSSGKQDPAHGMQIVGMSATMPNVGAVADWLQAALYQTDFRPVPLEEYIKVGNTIYNKNMDIVRTISKAADLGGKDPDHVVELCNEVVQEGHSVLIFCSSRKGCESTAKHISKFLRSSKVSSQNSDAEYADITSAIDALRRCPVGLDPVLEETLPFGIAYHHAGLTVEEREVVETCYRKGLIRVLTATSTLAAGVNLPARRVIFRQPKIGRDFIDGTRYKQMSGRAGRTGIDTKGESVLICKPEEIKRISGLLNESCPPLHSCLSEDMNGMIHAILEVVAGGIVQTAKDIHRYVRCTLLNSTKPFQDVVKSAQESLRWLCHMKFLEWNEDTKLYSTTPLGRASFGSSLSPEESLIVLDDLTRAREGFVLASDLHLVYLVTPINVDVEPNWELYYERFMQLSPLDQSVGHRVGVAEPFLMRMAHGAPIRTSKPKENTSGLRSKGQNQLGITNNTLLSDDQALRVCKRFYVALILSRLVQEAPVPEVCEAFKVARGMVQALQENAGRFASMVTVFCERLGWQDLEGLVGKFQNRVSFGVRAEIVELTTIPYVKGSRARALYKAGLRTPLSIAEASVAEIVKALFEKSSWAGQAQRRIQLGVAKKIKNGARKMVLEKAEEARVAAFAAFKSLGLNVPQFPGQSLSTAVGNSYEQGGAASSGNDTGNSAVNVEQVERAAQPSVQETVHSEKVVSASEEKITKTLNTSVVAFEVNSNAVVPRKFGLDESTVLTEQPVTLQTEHEATVSHSKDDNLTHLIKPQEEGDRNMIGNQAIDPQPGMQQSNIRLSCGVRVSANEKGPMHATNVPGGFDSFLDLWEKCLHLNVRQFSVQKFRSQNLEEINRGFEIIDSSFVLLTPICVNYGIDMCIVAWILWPDEERSSSPNLEKEVKKRLSSELRLLLIKMVGGRIRLRRAAHNGCCRRVAQYEHCVRVLWKLIVNILADMELWGIGMTFSLYTAADIANVLYGHLKLPIPETSNNREAHPSTDKHCLDLLRHEHPIVPVIKEHRTLAKLLNCTLGSICSLAKLSVGTDNKHTLHGHGFKRQLQLNVEHMVVFQINKDKKGKEADAADSYEINARDYFVPTQVLMNEIRPKGWCMAFSMEWVLTPWQRTLGCSPAEAGEKIRSFRNLFLELLVGFMKCYVKTIKGRKTVLVKNKLGNSKEKSKAERQAVNSICQVHDELVLESGSLCNNRSCFMLQMSMENATSLLVPLQVKLKPEENGGSMEPFQDDK
ncbi:hypothetical protein F8388_026571 [Cannabis sativa]|uniref:Helicase and polymerase-containing protein TEBICHI n=1 Tax=Cannabis sativa TaxID=3483 RepID=A0A7J6EAF4_CANSA|nr:hypothetical protein F8388_026571 [Cannabis sativa]